MLRRNHSFLRFAAFGICLLVPALAADCGGDGGSSGSGMDRGECFRPYECVKQCGGMVVTSGCCPCPAGTFDDLDCKDGGADAGQD